MQNCIFSGHCSKQVCDKSCPTLAETTYLLERNKISMNSEVFHADPKRLVKMANIVDSSEGTLRTVITKNTVQDADLLSYIAICRNWKGSRLHCTVYNLRYSQYIEMMKKSWSAKSETSELEYMRIFSSSAKVLIISNIDYVNFRDFECQTLLTLLQSRSSGEYTTIIVSPPVTSLVGDSPFFGRLTEIIKEATK
nr:MAG TPA: hypothetical protein [Caudoviricetes sp.]